MFSGLLGLADFIDEMGRRHSNKELAGYLRTYISDYWDLRVDPATGWTDSELREKIIEQIVKRYETVPYDLRIGELNVDRTIVELAPRAVKLKAAVPVPAPVKPEDVLVKSSALSAEDIRKLVESVFAGSTEAYKQYMTTTYLRKKQENKPIPVPASMAAAVPAEVRVSYTWAWVAGGIAVVGLLAFALTRRGGGSTAGSTVDLKPITG